MFIAAANVPRPPTDPRTPNGLADRGKLRRCEQREARRPRILVVFEGGATKRCEADARFPDGSQTVRCSRRRKRERLSAFLGYNRGAMSKARDVREDFGDEV